MVRATLMLLAILVCITPANAERMISVDELRLLAGDADRVSREKQTRIKGGDLSQLLPEQKRHEPVVVKQKSTAQTPLTPASVVQPVASIVEVTPRATKYSHGHMNTASATVNPAKQVVHPDSLTTAEKLPDVITAKPFEYLPPPRTGTADNSVFTDAVTVDELQYGIRIGTWIEVEMLRNISSGEPGVVSFRVSEPFQGRHRVLESGTELFAEKQFNSTTQRLEMMVARGVTLSGEEFEIHGQVYDMQKVSGLDGIVKKKEVVKGGLQSGFLAATRSALGAVAKDSPIGAGTATAADIVLSEGEDAVAAQLQAQYVIYVSSQNAKMFITQAF